MTTCIAAACQSNGEARIVCCIDTLVSSDVWSSETEFKLYDLSPSPFVGLYARDVSQALELLGIYRDHLATLFPAELPLSPQEIQGQLRIPIDIMRARMIEHHVRRRLGISYAEFRNALKTIGDLDLVKKVLGEIDVLSIEVELIIAGFYPTPPPPGELGCLLYRVTFERVEHHRPFTCIGAGLEAAEHVLHRRKQQVNRSVAETFYNVYEAKRESELAPSVGKETYVIRIKPPLVNTHRPRVCVYGDETLDGLKRFYKRYGPRDIKGVHFSKGLAAFGLNAEDDED